MEDRMSNTWKMRMPSIMRHGSTNLLQTLGVLLLCLFSTAHSRSTFVKPALCVINRYERQAGERLAPRRNEMEQKYGRQVPNNRKKLQFALITSNNPAERDASLKEDDDIDLDFEVAKNQIYSEVKEVESVFKGFLARVMNHTIQYLKQKVAQSCLQFYIVNPLGMGIGNLLNGSLNDQYITNKLGMPDNATPETFNMAYEEVNVPSHFGSKVTKRCWLIRSNTRDATKAFVLMHGWFGNMQSCLHFADSLRKIGILDTHHLLILDLHDDIGKSFESNIGLKGVTDLYDAAAYLNTELGVTDLSIYAQSISGLSSLMFYDECQKSLLKKGNKDEAERSRCPVMAGMTYDVLKAVNIERIIIESPVANIRQHILNSPSESFKWLTEQFLSTIDSEGSHLEKLSLQKLLKDPNTCSKVFIMQGSKDTITTPEMLKNEMTKGEIPKQVTTFLFSTGGHANLSATVGEEYLETLKYVILGRNIWEFILGKGTRSRIRDPEDITK